MLIFIVAFAINALASALAQSTDALPSDNQHYGEIADPSVWPISAVGVVTVALFSRKMYCTGTLVPRVTNAVTQADPTAPAPIIPAFILHSCRRGGERCLPALGRWSPRSNLRPVHKDSPLRVI